MKQRMSRWQRLWSSAADLDAEQMRLNAVEFGADAITDVVSGQTTTLTGVLHSVIYRAETATPMLQADLYDGSGHIDLRWMGRTRIRGINPGVSIAVHGRLVRCDGHLTMFNPNYTLLPKGGSE